MKKLALLTLTAITVGPASATVVIPTGIMAFHQGDSASGNGSHLKTIDGSGMAKGDTDDPSTWTVSSIAWADDWQGFEAPGVTPNGTWAVLDLGAPTEFLDQMYLWNVQENAPGNQSNRGMNSFNVYYSTSPTLTPPATSATPTAYDFASGGWTPLSGFDLAVGTGVGDAGEAFDVSGASGAQYIGIEIVSNHGAGDRSGFAEVALTVVPEPGSVMLLFGGGLLGLLRRRRA